MPLKRSAAVLTMFNAKIKIICDGVGAETR